MPAPKLGIPHLSETYLFLADAYTEGAAEARRGGPFNRRVQRTADAMDAAAARYRGQADAERRWVRTATTGATR